jgi:hypothetical protein
LSVPSATQILIFPIFGLHTMLAQNLKMGAILFLREHHTVVRLAAAVRGAKGAVGSSEGRPTLPM